MKKSIIPGGDENECFLCHRWGPEHRHHCLHGPDRNMAEKYGLTVRLCFDCHRVLHDEGEHDWELKQVAQRAFEKKYSHEKWMEVFGRNYL